ncbi:MAG: septum formation initiator family protein [Candidatus Komeilibacteria bacterium]|nr:septum formation initiator family protein [Candidatus Komeilibacteria bacterium]
MRTSFRFHWAQIISLVLVLFIIIFTIKTVQEVLNRRSLNNEFSGLDQQITDLQTKQQSLENLITYLQSSDFIEKEARTRLNLRKEGERIIIIPETSTTSVAPILVNQVTTSTPPKLSNLKKWWQYIFPNK